MTSRYPWGPPISPWDEVRGEIDAKVPLRRIYNGDEEKQPDSGRNTSAYVPQDSDELSEVEGKLSPLVQEGLRIMVCIGYEMRPTRFGPKDYLLWRDEETAELLNQFFNHPDKYRYKKGSKAVRNYIVAMGKRPKRLDRMSLTNLVGLRAEVYVETVKPEFSVGALKGQPMSESLHYSKVAEIMRPLGWVDRDTLTQLRKK